MVAVSPSIPSPFASICSAVAPSSPSPFLFLLLIALLSIQCAIPNQFLVYQSGLMSQASSSTTCTRRSSAARVALQPTPLVVVAAAPLPMVVDLETLIDDVSGLPLIMCPDCKDVRVFAANTTQSGLNFGKRYFKCPRKNYQNVSVIIISILFEWACLRMVVFLAFS